MRQFLCLMLLMTSLLYSDEKDDLPLKIGNFSLPSSQQPGPLVGVGENIIGKGQTQVSLFADITAGTKNYKSDVIPSILYGITDDFSVYLNLPFAPKNKVQNNHSSGWEDIYIQIEYVYFSKQEIDNTDQATILANIAFPSGSTHKIPPTGFGSPSFTMGTTYNHTTFDWFYFGALEGILTTPYHHTQFGNQFLYEVGAGRSFWSPPGWIFAWMIEFNGVYSGKNRLDGTKDQDSGGNMIFITPSIWISSEKIIFQLGVGPVYTHLNGNQPNQYYSIDFNFGYTF